MLNKVLAFTVAVAAASALVAPDYASQVDNYDLRHFIHRCSYSAADLSSCFVRNGNLAIKELAKGFEELDIVSLNGFDIGDVFLNLENDISFLLEDVKSYAKAPKLEKAKLRFDEEGIFETLTLGYSLVDYYWEGRYSAIGFFNNTKIREKGNFKVDFGPFRGNYTAEFKQIEIDGEIYLKIRSQSGSKNYEQFNFIQSNVTTKGLPLTSDQFAQLKPAAVEAAIEKRLEYITFVFNQVLQEIPQNELFLP